LESNRRRREFNCLKQETSPAFSFSSGRRKRGGSQKAQIGWRRRGKWVEKVWGISFIYKKRKKKKKRKKRKKKKKKKNKNIKGIEGAENMRDPESRGKGCLKLPGGGRGKLSYSS